MAGTWLASPLYSRKKIQLVGAHVCVPVRDAIPIPALEGALVYPTG